jgi:hypothetical protein
MNMDWEVWVLLPDAADQHRRCLWFEDTSHCSTRQPLSYTILLLDLLTILDTEHMSAHLNDLVDEVHIVIIIVLLLRILHVVGQLECFVVVS